MRVKKREKVQGGDGREKGGEKKLPTLPQSISKGLRRWARDYATMPVKEHKKKITEAPKKLRGKRGKDNPWGSEFPTMINVCFSSTLRCYLFPFFFFGILNNNIQPHSRPQQAPTTLFFVAITFFSFFFLSFFFSFCNPTAQRPPTTPSH